MRKEIIYSGVASDGKKQISHIQDTSYSEAIEKFINKNEFMGYKVLIDCKEYGVLRQVYKTDKDITITKDNIHLYYEFMSDEDKNTPLLIEDLGMILPTPTSKEKKRFGLYLCPLCFEEFKTRTSNIKNNRTKHCPKCSQSLRKTTHGGTYTKLYIVWTNIKSRCNNPNNPSFKHYGGNGVTICKEWETNFATFEKWSLENGYKDGLKIDKDILCNSLNISPKIYSPSTCLWITHKENLRNTVSNTIYEYQGEKKCLSEWCEILNLNYNMVYTRLNSYGWSVEKSLSTK